MNVLLTKCVCVADVEEMALRKMPKFVRDYYQSGADDQETLKRNLSAFKRFFI